MEYISDYPGEQPVSFINDVAAPVNQEYGFDSYVDTELVPAVIADTLVDLPPIIELTKMTPLEEQAATERAVFFERVGQYDNREGIDTDRARHFLNALGFTVHADSLIVGDEHKDEVRAALLAAGIPEEHLVAAEEANILGAYWSEIGVTLVYRDGETDDVVESVYEHEQIHGTTGVEKVDDEDISFTEEGFATSLQFSYGSVVGLIFDKKAASDGNIPNKYRTDHMYVTGAAAWDVLFHVRPDLLDVAIASRADPTLLDDVAGMVNSVQPGLFEVMLGVPSYDDYDRTQTSFTQAMHTVMAAAGVRMSDLPYICDYGEGAQRIAKKLAVYEAQHNYRFQRNQG